jgi:hypothetical protein
MTLSFATSVSPRHNGPDTMSEERLVQSIVAKPLNT